MSEGSATTGDGLLKLNVRETLAFFDDPPQSAMGHATAVAGVLGEDLAASLFSHCIKTNKLGEAKVMQGEKVVRGGRKGPWLDRWIEVEWSTGGTTLFQTEIKNTSAHGTHGKPLALNASKAEIRKRRLERWGEIWDPVKRGLKWMGAAKVLVPMRPPEGRDANDVLPLLLLWNVVGPDRGARCVYLGKGGHLFKVENPRLLFEFEGSPGAQEARDFPWLFVFSMSRYLRSLLPEGYVELELAMPAAAERIETLVRLVGKTNGS